MASERATPERITIATAQYPLELLASWQEYADRITRWVADGARQGAQLLIFPEYAAMELAGLAGSGIAGDEGASLRAVAERREEADLLHAELARTHAVHILSGSGPAFASPARAPGALVNRNTLFAPCGASANYDKRILTPWERDWGLLPGSGPLPVFDTALGRIGIAICYDCEFPLLVRAMTELGADMLLFPSCTEKVTGWSRVRVGAMARALESQVVSVVSPLVGNAPWCAAADVNTGAAGLFGPADNGVSDTGVIVEGKRDVPGWVVGVADLAACRNVRSQGGTRNHAHWREQPGATGLDGHAALVPLHTLTSVALGPNTAN